MRSLAACPASRSSSQRRVAVSLCLPAVNERRDFQIDAAASATPSRTGVCALRQRPVDRRSLRARPPTPATRNNFIMPLSNPLLRQKPSRAAIRVQVLTVPRDQKLFTGRVDEGGPSRLIYSLPR